MDFNVWFLLKKVPHKMTHTLVLVSKVVNSQLMFNHLLGMIIFCEAGLDARSNWKSILYTSDPLWDGKQCGSFEQNCCNIPSLPWFHKVLSSNTTTDDIELRVCCDEKTDNEDVPLNFYEIFIKQ